MRTSGLILDLQDDSQGQVLRQIYSSSDDLPEEVKVAHPLTEQEKTTLPDDVFALVLVNGQESMRKYACVDPGNTLLNVEYFLRTRHKLPEEAQKVAAANLRTACSWYGLVHSELEKVALGLGAAKALIGPAMTGLSAATTVAGTSKQISGNLNQARQSGGMIQNFLKQGEATFTPLMPPPSSEQGKPAKTKAVIRKVGTVLQNNETGQSIKGQELVSQTPPTPPKQKRGRLITTPSSPAGFMETAEKVLHPHVDVTGSEAKVVVQEKKSSAFALRDRYPLDNLKQVKRAAAYFDEQGVRMSPADRHEYCVNMTKRAGALGIPVSEEAQKYGSETYAPEEEIKVAMDVRRNLASGNEKLIGMLNGLMSKQAHIPPEVFCETLGMIDTTFGLNHHYDRYVPDPYWTTYGLEKQAEFVETIGNETITGEQLQAFAKEKQDARGTLEKVFAMDLVDEFCKDPIGIFKSLPREQKLLIMRMASAVAGGE